MEQFTRSELISALAQHNPETPLIVFRAMSYKALSAEFEAIAKEADLEALQKTYIYLKEA